jgi:hypothetical protein
MTHYHCEGSCKGTSQKPGSCQAEECELFGEPLAACDGKKCGK